MNKNIKGIMLGALYVVGAIAFCGIIAIIAYKISISDLPEWFKYFLLH